MKKIGKVRIATPKNVDDHHQDEWGKINTMVFVNGKWIPSQNILNQKFINSENGIFGRFS